MSPVARRHGYSSPEFGSLFEKMFTRVLVADDDAFVLRCYQRAFTDSPSSSDSSKLESLSEELFGRDTANLPRPSFELVACSQGDEAVAEVIAAIDDDRPFDVVILDVRMPPGINGVEAAKRIRQRDPEVPLVFVSGYSDISSGELKRQIPPESKLHWFSKPLSFVELAKTVTQIVHGGGDP